MSIKKQLQKYYAKQGLTGKHLRKAIQWDMKAVSAEVKRKSADVRLGKGWKPTCLMDLYWAAMPSPKLYYWAHRDCGTGR